MELVGGDGCAQQGMGREPERGRGPRGEWGEREGDVGECVALVGASGASAEAGGGRRVAVGTGHALLVLLARGGGQLAGASGLGRAGWAAPGKSLFFLSFSVCLFIISVT